MSGTKCPVVPVDSVLLVLSPVEPVGVVRWPGRLPSGSRRRVRGGGPSTLWSLLGMPWSRARGYGGYKSISAEPKDQFDVITARTTKIHREGPAYPGLVLWRPLAQDAPTPEPVRTDRPARSLSWSHSATDDARPACHDVGRHGSHDDADERRGARCGRCVARTRASRPNVQVRGGVGVMSSIRRPWSSGCSWPVTRSGVERHGW